MGLQKGLERSGEANQSILGDSRKDGYHPEFFGWK
jgi:hypothetical protein